MHTLVIDREGKLERGGSDPALIDHPSSNRSLTPSGR